MPVQIASYDRQKGTVTASDFNVETTIISVPAKTEPFLVEGYLDLSNMDTDDVIEVREYISVDGTSLKLYGKKEYAGTQEVPIVRIYTKTTDGPYKVTFVQTAGATLKAIGYWFIIEQLATA